MMRNRPVDTPESRKKQRIGGALLYAGILINLVATLLPARAAYRTLAVTLLGIGIACLAASITYMILARRAS